MTDELFLLIFYLLLIFAVFLYAFIKELWPEIKEGYEKEYEAYTIAESNLVAAPAHKPPVLPPPVPEKIAFEAAVTPAPEPAVKILFAIERK